MSMTISTGDDSDEIDDDLERDDDDRDEEDERPRGRKPAPKDDDDEEEDDLADKSDDELKAEIKRLRSAVTKANASGRRNREKLKQLRAAQAEADDRDFDEDDDEGDEKPKPKREAGLDARTLQKSIDRAVKKEREALERQHTRDLIENRMETLLERAGADAKSVRLLKRELDFDELELDPKTRSVDGADDEIDRLKAEFPNLFRGSKAARRRINGGDDRDGGRSKKPMSATERQVALLQGQR